MADSVKVGGYFVTDTWGNIRRTTINLTHRDDNWYYRSTEVTFIEADGLPAEKDLGGWNYTLPNGRVLHRPDRESRSGIVVQGDSDIAVFVLDLDAVAALERAGAKIHRFPNLDAQIVALLKTKYPPIYADIINQLRVDSYRSPTVGDHAVL